FQSCTHWRWCSAAIYQCCHVTVHGFTHWRPCVDWAGVRCERSQFKGTGSSFGDLIRASTCGIPMEIVGTIEAQRNYSVYFDRKEQRHTKSKRCQIVADTRIEIGGWRTVWNSNYRSTRFEANQSLEPSSIVRPIPQSLCKHQKINQAIWVRKQKSQVRHHTSLQLRRNMANQLSTG